MAQAQVFLSKTHKAGAWRVEAPLQSCISSSKRCYCSNSSSKRAVNTTYSAARLRQVNTKR